MGLGSLINYTKILWEILNRPDNDAVIVSLSIGIILLLFSHASTILSYRGRLRDKDRHIEDLVEQRNIFQSIVLGKKGLKRKSTNDDK